MLSISAIWAARSAPIARPEDCGPGALVGAAALAGEGVDGATGALLLAASGAGGGAGVAC